MSVDVDDWSTTPANNTSIDGEDITITMRPSNVDGAIRAVMAGTAQLRDKTVFNENDSSFSISAGSSTLFGDSTGMLKWNNGTILYTGGTIPHGWFESAITLTSGAIDLTLGNCFLLTITANTTLTFTNAENCTVFTLILTNGGSKTITYPTNVKWNDNLPPELTASGVDILTFITPDGGTTWYGLQAVMNVSVA